MILLSSLLNQLNIFGAQILVVAQEMNQVLGMWGSTGSSEEFIIGHRQLMIKKEEIKFSSVRERTGIGYNIYYYYHTSHSKQKF